MQRTYSIVVRSLKILLEHYPVLIYDGMMDIVVHSTCNLLMLDAMENWSGIPAYQAAERELFLGPDGNVAGYLVSAANLRLLAMRNANHMVPRTQPEASLKMLQEFMEGRL